MNILFIIDSLAAGGAEIATIELAQNLQRKGHDILILSIRDDMMKALPSEINIISLGYRKRRFLPYNQIHSFALKRLVRRLEHVHGQFDLIFSTLMLSNKLCQSLAHDNIFYTIHSALTPGYLEHRKGLRRFIRALKLRHLYHNKRLITVCQDMANDIVNNIQIKPKSISVIHNPIDQNKIRRLSKSGSSKEAPDDYIVHVGRFDVMKRHDVLIQAYLRSGIEYPLLLVGDGPTRDQITEMLDQKKLHDRIFMLGYQANPYPYIARAKALCLSSDYEGLPNILVEALMLHTPVAATDCPTGPREILHKRLSRYLARPSDPDSLALAIQRALTDAKQNQYPFCDADLSRFQADNVAQQYLDLAKLLSSSSMQN